MATDRKPVQPVAHPVIRPVAGHVVRLVAIGLAGIALVGAGSGCAQLLELDELHSAPDSAPDGSVADATDATDGIRVPDASTGDAGDAVAPVDAVPDATTIDTLDTNDATNDATGDAAPDGTSILVDAPADAPRKPDSAVPADAPLPVDGPQAVDSAKPAPDTAEKSDAAVTDASPDGPPPDAPVILPDAADCEEGYEDRDGDGICESCAAGYQDNDQNDICIRDCTHYDCSLHGTCSDDSGVAICDCETGYQDNNHNNTCVPDCTTAALACGTHGSCDDTSGTAQCVCDAGYQDNDANNTCLPDCATAAPGCGDNGSCSDDMGVAVCECAEGFAGERCEIDLEDSLIARYLLDGNVKDALGVYNALGSGSLAYGADAFGAPTSALVLDGASFVQLPASVQDAIDIESVTLTLWVRLDSLLGDPTLVSFGTSSASTGISLVSSSSHLLAWIGDDTIESGVVSAGVWLHLALVSYGGGGMCLFVNGAEASCDYSHRGPFLTSTGTGHYYYLGRSVTVEPHYFAGAMDDVRLYTRNLTAHDVRGLYHSEFAAHRSASDWDGDGIPNDGNGSGAIGDAPCSCPWTGAVDCDDNAPLWVGQCPADMVGVPGIDVWIDQREASRGSSDEAVSAYGEMPWVNVSWYEASDACAWAGKRLCDASEWYAACSSADSRVYPYGSTYSKTACNGADLGIGAAGTTGSVSVCEGGYTGIFDMSGNVGEWVGLASGQACARGGSYTSFQVYLRCQSSLSLTPTTKYADK
ncbi:MAG: LamG-like jellyroll fold domain-containing protein, partial [Pseudomonadota bacterium]